ncbi:MAG TPA: dihydrofolate reductase family protein [Polyangiaceae bacterium]|nr:dihydrofolate reductase family protein [Polyangiaceae bacterium]
MRKLILKMSLSADGFVGGPNGELDWIFEAHDEGATLWTMDTLGNADLHIMGSRTFHDMAAYWPTSDEPYAPPMNEIPKVVFSKKGSVDPGNPELTTPGVKDARRVREARGGKPVAASPAASTWTEAVVASGDLREEVERLKRQPGKDILAHGGASFARSLVAENLIDEYRLLFHPVVLGRGLPLFSDLRETARLELLYTATFPAGAVARVFKRRNR